ncbi:MAG: hypothetical protein AAGA67_04000 [Cyanobacteria bacterium P01_F01_bin.153]
MDLPFEVDANQYELFASEADLTEENVALAARLNVAHVLAHPRYKDDIEAKEAMPDLGIEYPARRID